MDDIRRYEAMAMLSFDEMEREALAPLLNNALASFHVLDAADARDAEPLVSVVPSFAPLREDEPSQLVARDILLRGAPDQDGAYFRTPRVLE